MNTIHTYTNGRLEEKQTAIVREFPLVLHVNGREIATLIASPHDLRFLVAGFLRLQGFVESVSDFHMLSVCDDFGIANVRIRGELPERLKPVLTSGCGTGVTFTLSPARIPPPLAGGGEGEGEASMEEIGGRESSVGVERCSIAPDAIFRLMEELARRADNYKSHGGIHSAAVGDGEGNLLLFAEDIGRHNTLDRIAGEALFRGIDLAGKILVTSGRISTELAAKCARLGIAVVASRTSATDMAVKMCEKADICLVGYVRGGRFTVYAHRERLAVEETVGANLVFAQTAQTAQNGGRSQGSPLRRETLYESTACLRIPGRKASRFNLRTPRLCRTPRRGAGDGPHRKRQRPSRL